MTRWWGRVVRWFRGPATLEPLPVRSWQRQSTLPGMPAVDLLDLLDA